MAQWRWMLFSGLLVRLSASGFLCRHNQWKEEPSRAFLGSDASKYDHSASDARDLSNFLKEPSKKSLLVASQKAFFFTNLALLAEEQQQRLALELSTSLSLPLCSPTKL